ncbi:dihydrodipicolinate synthase family protein [Lentzea tibetensis]|uniref:Dihydrodipicolinate synthase family protein n=1 Tax=Lentzea tibetensis TaxID=2591470 RepID=A0A563EWU7_9PSEU|nr:dihydrodipicolinate synthase family protein [Lentzea tibetensis]TWP52175.1 dihydrodipicolinate synthase family protein [Lentzea tibetensis]
MSREVFAAAHVVTADERTVDWDATLRFRHHLWDLGLGVAEAMDTAQRGMGLEWPTAAELIKRSAAEATGRICAGVATDHLRGEVTIDDVQEAYVEQLDVVVTAGAQPVLMCSRQLAAAARGPEAYAKVYGALLDQVSEPVILHWLGTAFDPALEGYWGARDVTDATNNFLQIIREHSAKVDGVKVSLLDADHEIGLRRALPDGVRCYTGDDFNYPELIAGDEHGYSDALLGIFDPIAPVAAKALRALDSGDTAGFRKIIDPTVPLSRHLFSAPTYYYKTGVVFLAWLAGHQDHFLLLDGLQTARSVEHLAEAKRLAELAGVVDPELANRRWSEWLAQSR